MPKRLLPVQPNGDLPLNFFEVEAPPRDIEEQRAIQAQQIVEKPMNRERITELTATLNNYKSGKANLDERIVANEEWWKGRNWEQIRRKDEPVDEIEPASAWLFNALANKHADAMDNFPRANILPREKGDIEQAKILSSIIPVILDQANYEQTYSDVWDYKLKQGTGVTAVLWNKNLAHGLGDIEYSKVDLLNMYWEPGVSSIQDSPYLFITNIRDNKYLESAYPELRGKLGGQSISVKQYLYDDTVDVSNKSVVVDCYYKVQIGERTVLHLVKFVNDVILYSSENEDRNKGIYDHGIYPFVPDTLFKTEGTPAGFGYIDIGKPAQEYIDRADKALLESLEESAGARTVVSNGCGLNEKEYANRRNKIIHANDLSDDNFKIVQTPPVSSVYVQIKENKIQELKEVTGNRDVSNGGTTSGVTAASAIAAMQEAGSKLSRDMIKSSYRAFRQIILLTIELIRQFYDIPRQFRILGDGASAEEYRFLAYSNEKIVAQPQFGANGTNIGDRLPLFDVEITAEKSSPYSRMSRNELALQFYSAGFFAPENSEQALACMEMLDFDGKDRVIERIAQNGGLYEMYMQRTQQALQLAQIVDQMTGGNNTQQIAAGMAMPQSAPNTQSEAPQMNTGEAAITKNARQRVAESTSPT